MDWYIVIIWILVMVAFDTICIIVGAVRDNRRIRKKDRDKKKRFNGGK